ncbi:MAG TPA: amino acid--tRNA ligase-related protein [bacterium]|jgi:aspartyl/asparaginyl-tRNA synthetase
MKTTQQVKLWDLLTRTSFNHWWSRGYTYVEVPALVRASGACEFVDSLMEASLDGRLNWGAQPVFLKQTGQLHLEGALGKFPKVFTAGRSFRGEQHDPSDGRHCLEFSLHEIEFRGEPADLYDALLNEIQSFVQALCSQLAANAEGLGLSDARVKLLDKWASTPFARLTYSEAIAELQSLGEPILWGEDFTHWQELKLAEAHGPVFMMKFPDPLWEHPELQSAQPCGATKRELKVIKFFNMLPDGEGRIDSADLILPGSGESVGAAVRLHKLDLLKDRLVHSLMFEHLVNRRFEWLVAAGKYPTMDEAAESVLEDFEPYFEEVGSHGLPHAGCGFGMNRIAQGLMGQATIEAIDAFPVTFANFRHAGVTPAPIAAFGGGTAPQTARSLEEVEAA